MTKLHTGPDPINPLALICEPAGLLDSAEDLLGLASRFALHGQEEHARQALGLVWPALHLASIAGLDAARIGLLSRAAQEAEDLLDNAAAVPALGEVA